MQPPSLNTTNCLFGSTDNFPGLLETKMGLTVEMEYGAFILFINPVPIPDKWSKTTWIGIYNYYFSKWMSRVNVFTQQSLCLLTDLFKLNSHSKNQSNQCWLDFYHNFAFWNCIQYTTLINHKSYLINRKRWTLVNNSKI